MHQMEQIHLNGLGRIIYRCMRVGCGEEVSVALAGSRDWYRQPLNEVYNTILNDERLRRVEIAADCPAAPAGIDALRTRARRRRKTRLYRTGYQKAA